METIEIFDRLKSLQVILGRKYELESKIEEAPKQLSSQDELLARMKKEYIEKNKSYEEVKERVTHLKDELDETIKTREDGEKNMDNITTHREYEALDKLISEASEREAEIRKLLQKEEKDLSELNESMKGIEMMINSQEADLNTSKASLDAQMASYKSELEELNAKEAEAVPGLDQEILFKFERIIQRNSEGIVAVKNGVCTGCHMILPANFANEVREGENIKFCPYCSRILYYEELSEDEAESYFDISAVGSLAGFDDDDLLDEDEELDEDERDEDSEDAFENEDSDLDDEDADDEDADDVDDEDDEDDEE